MIVVRHSALRTQPHAGAGVLHVPSFYLPPVLKYLRDHNTTSPLRRAAMQPATSRLEDLASSPAPFDSSQSPSNSGPGVVGEATSSSADHPAQATLPNAGQPTARLSGPSLPTSIIEMDEILNSEVKSFVAASEGIDTLVQKQASSAAKAFADHRRFLLMTTKAKQPATTDQDTWQLLLEHLNQDLNSVNDARHNHGGSLLKDHLAMVAEGVGALQWLLVPDTPAEYVTDIIDGTQMYSNRVLKEHRERYSLP
nr:adenylyl cyclase-associated protein [Quercus suber]